MKLNFKKSYVVFLPLMAFIVMLSVFLFNGTDTAYAAGGETKLYKAAFSYTTYLCSNTTETLHSSGNGVTACTSDSSQYGTSDVSFDIYGASYSGEGILNGGYLNSSSVHVIANTGWSTSSIKLKSSSGEQLASGSVSLSATLEDGTYTVVYEGTGQGWLVNGREYNHYKIVCSFTFGVDTVKPLINGIGTEMGYVNKSVTITPEDGLSGICALYMKNPSSSSFTKVSSPYTLSDTDQNGKYTFYSEDNAGNRSRDYMVFMDTEKPKLKVKKNGYEITDKYISGGLSVSATDNGETDKIYISENGGEFRVFDGTYQENCDLKFKATDKAGNESEVREVYVDTLAPSGKITGGDGSEINSGYISTQNGIKYTAEDSGSKIKKRMVKMPGSSSFTSYNGYILFDEGEYSFYSEDNAGNRSETVTVCVDNTKPVVKMFEGENQVNKSYSKAAYIKFYAEDENGLESLTLYKDGISISYSNLGKIYDEGQYVFFAVDKAGNRSSQISLTLDRTAPSADIFAGGIYCTDTISNKESFFISVYDTCSDVKSIMVSKDGSSYENYSNGSEIKDEGRYCFIFTDNADNESQPLHFSLDKTPPECTLYDENAYEVNLYANTNVVFSCQDGSGVSGVYYKSHSDLSYSGYDLDQVLEDGHYYFYATDVAGNTSEVFEAIIDRVKPVLELYSGDTLLKDVNSVNNTIRVYGSDENTISIFVLLPGETQYASYNEGNILSSEGTYSFYAEDAAGNISDTLTVTIDKSGPVVRLYTENGETESGSFVNSKIKAESYDLSGSLMFVKIPGSSIYCSYSGEYLSGEGTYYFYAVDGVNYSSSECLVTVDYTSPSGSVYAEGNKTASLYSNAQYITYASSDSLSGIFKDYVFINGEKREYKGEMLSFEGHYVFVTADRAGNESNQSEIYLDRTKPLGLINCGGAERTNKPFSFTCSDETMLKDIYIQRPGMDYALYTNGEIVSDLTDGYYRFYCTDMAGNESLIYSVIVDVTSPGGFIAKGGKIYTDQFINSSFEYVSERDASLFIKKPGSDEFTDYDGEIIDETCLNGEYSFYAQDRAGNLSVITSITLDSIKPVSYIYSDGFSVSVQFTNKDIYFESEDENGISVSYLIFNGDKGEYSGEKITKEGCYEFYCVDNAGNVSETLTITVDKTKPLVKVYGQFDSEVPEFTDSERIYMNAEDDNLSASYIKRPSKSVYEPYSLMAVYSEEGRYSFYSADKAGNISDIVSVTVDRTKDFVTIEGENDGTVNGSCRILWKNTGLSPVKKVTVNGREIENGETITVLDGGNYEVILEDEAGNRGKTVFGGVQSIFEKTPLKEWYEVNSYSFASYERALEYADGDKEKVTHFYYFEKSPSPEYEGENVYKESYTLNSFRLISGLKYEVNNEEISGLNYSKEGVHKVRVSDGFSNSKIYDVLILSSKDKINDENGTLDDSEYFFTERKKLSLKSIDEDALLIVKNDLGQVLEILGNNEEYGISEPVVYLSAVNRYGTSKPVSIYFSENPGEINIEKAEDSKKLYISYSASSDKYARVRSFKIFRFEGSDFKELEKDDYRKDIGAGVYSYAFRTSGHFRAELEDNFRYGENKVIAEFEFVKAPPEINITDVSSYYINQDVYVSFDDEAYITLTKDGKEKPFEGGRLKEEGKYVLVFSDYDGYSVRYLFEIDKTPPSYTLSGCSLNSVTNQNVEITIQEDNVKLTVVRNGKEISVSSGDTIVSPGIYDFTIEDPAGNTASGSFTIDKSVDYLISTLNGGVSSEDVIIEGNENVRISLLKDNQELAVSSGERISAEGYYTGEIEDDAGNKEKVSFRILKSKVQSFSLDLDSSISLVSAYKNQESFTSKSPFVFNEDGTYSITLTDGERNASFVIIIDTKAPEVELDGVMNGGKTKKEVKVKSVSEECTLRAYLNGRPIAFSMDSVLKDEGVYTLYFTDTAGNETDISFEIKNGPDAVVIFLVILIVLIVVILVVFLIKSKKKKGPDIASHVTRENPEEDEEKKDIKEEEETPEKEEEKEKEKEKEISTEEADEISSRDEILKRLEEEEKEEAPDPDLVAERDLLFSPERRSKMDAIIIKENSFAEDFSDGFIDKGLIKGGDRNGRF